MRRRQGATRTSGGTRVAATREHVTPYDRFAWGDTEIERWLASGAHAEELGAYFGRGEYRQLAALARRAERAPVNTKAPRVILVPGMMGSQLGLLRPPPLPNDILWIDPIDIQHGRLELLRLPGPARVVALGVVLFSYLRLKLQLRAHGFAVESHDYDWRLSVLELGEQLAARVRSVASGYVAIVAHSMGGLVARVALARPGTAHVARLILLGTPNLGSFAAVQALRGTYAVVRKVARLDGNRSAETLTRAVFSSFPGLYDLLPCDGDADLFDPACWPASGPRPRAPLLRAARRARRHYAAADERFAVIAGTGQETVTAAARHREEFVYTLTRHGDGTVPTASAVLPGAHCVYARVAHSELTRDPEVAAAVVDLLRRGRTTRLPQQWRSASRACVRVTDRQLQRSQLQKVDWGALTPEQRRLFLENLNEPPHLKLRVPRAHPARTRCGR
jgi:pimeloyl-ACP methyl ester carboxylesterase